MNNPLLIFVLILTIACGVSTESSGPTDYDASIPIDAELMVGDQFASDVDMMIDPTSVVGHWAQQVVLAGIAEVPVLGFQETDTIGLGLVQITELNGQLNYKLKICQTRIKRPDDIVTTQIPEAFIQSIPTYYRAVVADDDRVLFSQMAELNGVRLSDPFEEELPTSDTDPRIFDQDEDGLPGVTVFVTGLVSGKIHLIQRTITQMEGTLEDDRISGLVDWSISEQILGADEPLLEMGAPITPNTDRSRSQFEMIRVSQNLDCAQLIESAPNWFVQPMPGSE